MGLAAGPLSLFYDTLFHPVRLFRAIGQASDVSWAVLAQAVLLSLLVYGFVSLDPESLRHTKSWTGVTLYFLGVFTGSVGFWLLHVVLLAGLAYVFRQSARLKTLLTVTALASLPFMMAPPLELLRLSIPGVGFFIWLLGFLGLTLWSTALFVLALCETYRLDWLRVTIFFGLPLLFVLGGFALAMFIAVMATLSVFF
jgi:hypothetical protein